MACGAACFCRKFRLNMAGTARPFSNRPAVKPACRWMPGGMPVTIEAFVAEVFGDNEQGQNDL